MRKKTASILLTLALLLSLLPALGGTARAANASSLCIAGNSEHFTEYGDDEECYIIYTGGYTQLESGQSVSRNGRYENGGTAAFTYNANTSSVLVLDGYETSDSAGYLSDDSLYGLYYEGDLEIQVNGDCSLWHYVTESENYTNIYGIYVTGDLTITGTGTLNVNMCSHMTGTDTTASHVSAGVCCGGALTIQSTGADTLTAKCWGGAVSGASEAPGYSAGILCGFVASELGVPTTGSLTVSGGATLNATGGTVDFCGVVAYPSVSCGIAAGAVAIGTDGTVIAKGGALTNETATSTCGGFTAGIAASRYSQTKGAVDATGGMALCSEIVAGKVKDSYGVYAGSFAIEGGTLECAALEALGANCGLYQYSSTGTATLAGGSVTATAGGVLGTGENATYNAGDGSRGAEFNGAFTATAGSLEATGGSVCYGVPSIGVKLHAADIGGTAFVRGMGGENPCQLTFSDGKEVGTGIFSDSIGVYVFPAVLTLGGEAVLEGHGGYIPGSLNGSNSGSGDSIGVYLYGGGSAVSVSGGGTLRGFGGETGYGQAATSKNNNSFGIFAPLGLTVTGTAVEAAGGDVATRGTNPSVNSAQSCGLRVTSAAFTDCAVIATGGDVVNNSNNDKTTVHNSFGAYFAENVSLTRSTLTARAGKARRSVGVYLGGTLTLSGASAHLDAAALAYENGEGYYPSRAYAYGILTEEPIDAAEGSITVQGLTQAIYGADSVTARTYFGGTLFDGSNAALGLAYRHSWKYAELNVTRVIIDYVYEGNLSCTVLNVPAGGARLIAAWYDAGGKMLGAVSIDVDEGDTADPGLLSVGESAAAYQLMLVDKTTYVPLCKAVCLSERE